MAAPASPSEDMDVEVAAFLASCAASVRRPRPFRRLDAPPPCGAAPPGPCAAAWIRATDCLRRAFNFRIIPDDPRLQQQDVFAHPLAEPWAELLRSVQQKGGYSHVIASSTSFGKNLLLRAAALLDVSPVMDVTAICEQRVFVRIIYAGNALCTIRYTGESPCMMSIRSTSFSPATESMSETKVAPITQVDLSFLSEASSRKSSWVNLTSQDTEWPDLANAHVVVTGGTGLKSAENFKLLAQLAEKLGATVGATRAAVDAGYVPNELQVSSSNHRTNMRCFVSGTLIHLSFLFDIHSASESLSLMQITFENIRSEPHGMSD
ncbi:hypothetical protein ZWY2020_051741, partial [Hordeum vulgare]